MVFGLAGGSKHLAYVNSDLTSGWVLWLTFEICKVTQRMCFLYPAERKVIFTTQTWTSQRGPQILVRRILENVASQKMSFSPSPAESKRHFLFPLNQRLLWRQRQNKANARTVFIFVLYSKKWADKKPETGLHSESRWIFIIRNSPDEGSVSWLMDIIDFSSAVLCQQMRKLD